MQPIASHPRKRRSDTGESGFTLTELIAGLLVASLLVMGLIDITRRYARTTDRVKIAAADIHAIQLLAVVVDDLGRSDPGSLKLAPKEITARLGGRTLIARITAKPHGSVLAWSSPTAERVIDLPQNAHFSRKPSGAIALETTADEPPLATIVPQRTLPPGCQLGAMIAECGT